MPDFQQFAERCVIDQQSVMDSHCRATLVEAERHARLLQQIWEYVNTPTALDDLFTVSVSKAHVRSLLVSQTEEK